MSRMSSSCETIFPIGGDVARTACASVCFAVILHIITLPDAPAVVRIPVAPFIRRYPGCVIGTGPFPGRPSLGNSLTARWRRQTLSSALQYEAETFNFLADSG